MQKFHVISVPSSNPSPDGLHAAFAALVSEINDHLPHFVTHRELHLIMVTLIQLTNDIAALQAAVKQALDAIKTVSPEVDLTDVDTKIKDLTMAITTALAPTPTPVTPGAVAPVEPIV